MTMRVSVAVAWRDRQVVVELDLRDGSTVADAVAAARLHPELAREDLSGMQAGIWSRPCGVDRVLRDGDRVELYRPLIADPKAMRRARAARRRS